MIAILFRVFLFFIFLSVIILILGFLLDKIFGVDILIPLYKFFVKISKRNKDGLEYMTKAKKKIEKKKKKHYWD